MLCHNKETFKDKTQGSLTERLFETILSGKHQTLTGNPVYLSFRITLFVPRVTRTLNVTEFLSRNHILFSVSHKGLFRN